MQQSWDPQGEAALALTRAVEGFGPQVLGRADMLSGLLEDDIPHLPREVALLTAAARSGTYARLTDRVRQGLPPDHAVSMAATEMASRTAMDASGAQWAVGEFARVLGHQLQATTSPASAPPTQSEASTKLPPHTPASQHERGPSGTPAAGAARQPPSRSPSPASPFRRQPQDPVIKRLLIGSLLGLVVLAAAIGLAISQARAPNMRHVAFNQLRAGDCVAGPRLVSDSDRSSPYTVVPCTQNHRAEVYLTENLWPDSASYPGYDAERSRTDARCIAAFRGYDGTPYKQSALRITDWFPDANRWSYGDREVLCAIFKQTTEYTGGTPLHRSVKGSFR